jgi:hypothetical protein
MPLKAGCHAVVWVKEDPMMANSLETTSLELLAWSVVISWGQPNRAPQETKALATTSAVISEGVA